MIWAGGAGVCWVYAVWVVVVFLPGSALLVGVGAVSVRSFLGRPCPPGAAGVGVVVGVRPLGLVLTVQYIHVLQYSMNVEPNIGR